MNPPPVITPEERAHRVAKAVALADVVQPLILPIVDRDRATAARDERARYATRTLRDLPESARQTAATLAGTRPPSGHTWEVMIGIIASRIEHGNL